MVVLKKLPEQAIVDGFKGTVDFYVCRGIPVARKWPHYPRRTPYPAELANQLAFSYITKALSSLPEHVIAQWKAQTAGTPFTWRDLAIRAYMRGIDY